MTRTLTGEWRTPRQLLGDQEFAGHASIHDDATAAALGFRGGTIEGPTHFSQFAPLLAGLWGREWFEVGCLSAHFQNACYAGEKVRASVLVPDGGSRVVTVSMEKEDGTQVLTGTASLGPLHPETELDRRLAKLRPPERLVLLDKLAVGDRPPAERVRMGLGETKGPLYPFSLAQKLAVITEDHEWYRDSPWGKAVLPLEMVSVLTQYTSDEVFPIRQPSVALFVDQEIRMERGPLLVDTDYELQREVVALSESRRTESFWVRTEVREVGSTDVVATTLLHTGVLKESYPDYPAE